LPYKEHDRCDLGEYEMLIIQTSIPSRSLSAAKKAGVIKRLTDAEVEAEGIPAACALTCVYINEVPDWVGASLATP
jgi:phenylpyruvate tautomerase PptA (4-oxalocrotonate tautomerase family)